MDSPELNTEQQTLSAGAIWTIQGDAGTRALAAWHMGRANESGTYDVSWHAPLLGLLMTDTYDAVRFVAYDALRKHAGFEDYSFDFVLPPKAAIFQDVVERWGKTALFSIAKNSLSEAKASFCETKCCRY